MVCRTYFEEYLVDLNATQAAIMAVQRFAQSESFDAWNPVSENAGACGLPLNDLVPRIRGREVLRVGHEVV